LNTQIHDATCLQFETYSKTILFFLMIALHLLRSLSKNAENSSGLEPVA